MLREPIRASDTATPCLAILTLLIAFGLLGRQPAAAQEVLTTNDEVLNTDDKVPPDASTTARSVRHRPLLDFLDAQGTYCFNDGDGGCLFPTAPAGLGQIPQLPTTDGLPSPGQFCIDASERGCVPMMRNFIGWADMPTSLAASVDYAGLADAWIVEVSDGYMSCGTTFNGTITEQVRSDGRARVHVRLYTENALIWAFECSKSGNCNFAGASTLFGHRATEVLRGDNVALGSSALDITFINTAPSTPLPDLLQLLFDPLPGQEIIQFEFTAEAFAALSDGTPAMLHITQTGSLEIPALGEPLPADNIAITPLH